MPHKPGHIKTGQGGRPLGSTTRRGGKSVGGGNKTTPKKEKKNGTTNTNKDNRTSEVLAALSDFAGERVEERKGGTHTPEGSGVRKSGASHNAEFIKVWNEGDNYNINVPIS